MDGELSFLAGVPVGDAGEWLLSRQSPIFGLGRGLSTANQWLRIGWGKNWKLGRYVFRASGRVVEMLTRGRSHIDFFIGPPID